jgi:hypothetical protein
MFLLHVQHGRLPLWSRYAHSRERRKDRLYANGTEMMGNEMRVEGGIAYAYAAKESSPCAAPLGLQTFRRFHLLIATDVYASIGSFGAGEAAVVTRCTGAPSR